MITITISSGVGEGRTTLAHLISSFLDGLGIANNVDDGDEKPGPASLLRHAAALVHEQTKNQAAVSIRTQIVRQPGGNPAPPAEVSRAYPDLRIRVLAPGVEEPASLYERSLLAATYVGGEWVIHDRPASVMPTVAKPFKGDLALLVAIHEVAEAYRRTPEVPPVVLTPVGVVPPVVLTPASVPDAPPSQRKGGNLCEEVIREVAAAAGLTVLKRVTTGTEVSGFATFELSGPLAGVRSALSVLYSHPFAQMRQSDVDKSQYVHIESVWFDNRPRV